MCVCVCVPVPVWVLVGVLPGSDYPDDRTTWLPSAAAADQILFLFGQILFLLFEQILFLFEQILFLSDQILFFPRLPQCKTKALKFFYQVKVTRQSHSGPRI